jgi:aspartate kinase
MKVAKFGGTSLANAKQIKKVICIIKSDPKRRCVVVSAPGKRNSGDKKITDLLYSWVRSPDQEVKQAVETTIVSRYQEIIDNFGLAINFGEWFEHAADTYKKMGKRYKKDYLASRGEYWMARIMAQILGYTFIDASSFVIFKRKGILDIPRTEKMARKIKLKILAAEKGIVVPGFYGTTPTGHIKTFSRGGSDITGAIVALCAGAELYENWTDVSGVFMTDPRIVKKPRKINKLTYRELRELAYMGADVLHDESIFPVRKVGIPINVRNTNQPKNKGTMIVPDIGQGERVPGSIIGIAGRKGFSVITIEKALMDNEVGFLLGVCGVIAGHGINIEHIPGGIDTLSVIVESPGFDAVSKKVLTELRRKCNPDAVNVERNVALICIVGSAMAKTPGVAARIFTSVASAGVNIRMIDQGSSEISIIVGVNEKDYETTIHAIYHKFAN